MRKLEKIKKGRNDTSYTGEQQKRMNSGVGRRERERVHQPVSRSRTPQYFTLDGIFAAVVADATDVAIAVIDAAAAAAVAAPP